MPTTFDDLPEEIVLEIFSFVPSHPLVSDVALVNLKFGRIVVDKSLWKNVHFYLSDTPENIAEVLARSSGTIQTVTLWSGGVEETEKIRALIESKVELEEIHMLLVEKREDSRELNLSLLFQLIGESTKVLSLPRVEGCKRFCYPTLVMPRSVHVLPNSQRLISLDLSAVAEVNDRIIRAIVAACPQLELLHIGQFDSTYTDAGIRAIANGLHNLASVFFSCVNGSDDSFSYLLSRRPRLSAFGLKNVNQALPRTAVLLSQMRDLQYLLVEGWIGRETPRDVFENANFSQLKTLVLEEVKDFDREALEKMALACPKLQRLVLNLKGKSPPGAEEAVFNRIVNSCPELDAFCFRGSTALTGEGWLENVDTLLPALQCIVISCGWSDESSPELLRRADRARSQNRRLSVFVGSTPQPFNEKVDICDDDVVNVLGASPRLSDLKARRVRFLHVLEQAVRSKLAKNEARSWLRYYS